MLAFLCYLCRMNIDYLKKATGTLTATSLIDHNTFFALPTYPGEVKVPVEVRNADGVLVTKADVRKPCLSRHSIFIGLACLCERVLHGFTVL